MMTKETVERKVERIILRKPREIRDDDEEEEMEKEVNKKKGAK